MQRYPKRIIALYSAFNEILVSIGAKDLLVARTAQDSLQDIASLPAIGTHMRPNLELIAAYKPDLVIQLQGRTDAQLQTQALRDLGLTVLEFPLNSFTDMWHVTKIFGLLTQHQTQAYSAILSWQKRLNEIEARHIGQTTHTVVFEVRSPDLLVAGANNICSEIIKISGGKNVVTTAKKLVHINEEAILKLNPDVYIIQTGPMNPSPLPLAQRPTLKMLKAAQNGRSLLVREDMFSRPGPMAIDACDQLERWLYAESRAKNTTPQKTLP